MRAANQMYSIMSMPQEAFREIAKKLALNNSKTPWQDLLHIGSTCKALYQLKNDYSASWREHHWPKCPEDKNWHKQLRNIMDTSLTSAEGRLFREPMLRSLANDARAPAQSKDSIRPDDQFWLYLYHKRDALSLSEIRDCLSKLHHLNPTDRRKLLNQLPSQLGSLNAEDKPHAALEIFRSIAKEVAGTSLLCIRDLLNTLREAISNDSTALALVDLKMIHAGPAFSSIGGKTIDKILNLLPEENRWSLLVMHIPEIFESSSGIYALAGDSGCRPQLTQHLAKQFSECINIKQKIDICRWVATVSKLLSETEEGKQLWEMTGTWFVNQSIDDLSVKWGSKTGESYARTLIVHLCSMHHVPITTNLDELTCRVKDCFEGLIKIESGENAAKLLAAVANYDIRSFPTLNPLSMIQVASLYFIKNLLHRVGNMETRHEIWHRVLKGVSSSKDRYGSESMMTALEKSICLLAAEKQDECRKKLIDI